MVELELLLVSLKCRFGDWGRTLLHWINKSTPAQAHLLDHLFRQAKLASQLASSQDGNGLA